MPAFKQKLSVRTQIALHRLIADAKEVANDNDPEALNVWTGEFVLSYDDGRRYPRLIIFMDHSIPAKADGSTSGSGFGMWWTDDPEQGLTADEDLMVLMRG